MSTQIFHPRTEIGTNYVGGHLHSSGILLVQGLGWKESPGFPRDIYAFGISQISHEPKTLISMVNPWVNLKSCLKKERTKVYCKRWSIQKCQSLKNCIYFIGGKCQLCWKELCSVDQRIQVLGLKFTLWDWELPSLLCSLSETERMARKMTLKVSSVC